MALVIEDGSVVADANSYITVAEARAYAAARGVELAPDGSEGDDAIAVMAVSAMDYLEALRYRFKGSRVNPSVQRLSWPRQDAYTIAETPYEAFPSDEIPQELKDAQAALIIEIKNGITLLPTVAGGGGEFVKREKIGPIETEYSEAVRLSASRLPVMPHVEALLSPLLKSVGALRTYRV